MTGGEISSDPKTPKASVSFFPEAHRGYSNSSVKISALIQRYRYRDGNILNRFNKIVIHWHERFRVVVGRRLTLNTFQILPQVLYMCFPKTYTIPLQ